MWEQRKVSSLMSAIPKLNYLNERADDIVVGNDICVSSLQLQNEVLDSLKKHIQNIYMVRQLKL
jgi:hypothetical protein